MTGKKVRHRFSSHGAARRELFVLEMMHQLTNI
jgi:hypothetical protein